MHPTKIAYTIGRRQDSAHKPANAPEGDLRGVSSYPGVTMPTLDPDMRLSTAEAAVYFGVKKGTINRWYTLGHLADTTLDDNGHRRHRLGTLLEAERATRRNPNSSRSTIRRLHAA